MERNAGFTGGLCWCTTLLNHVYWLISVNRQRHKGPCVTQGASRKLEKLHIFGNDYDTPDGTCIRDYIHVVDLARGHVNAFKAIQNNCGLVTYNLGTGKGYSVLELVEAFERVNGIKIPYVLCH